MDKAYQTYRIEVVSRERVRFEKRSSQNEVLEESPAGNLCYQQKLKEVKALVESASKNTLNQASEVRKLGETLFDILFENDERCQDFVQFYTEVVQGKDQFLRVELDIDEQMMPDLAALPWEFMCLPARLNHQELWLGTDPKIVFSRHRALWTAPPPIQVGKNEKLRIALLVSSPSELRQFNYEPVQEALNKLASEQAERVELLPVVKQGDRVSINEILEKEPHIFHFIGHGQLKKPEKFGQIALVDKETNESDWIDADKFSGLFAKHRPGIVVLQACEGANSASQAFASVASKVVQQNIPLVLAMQYLVPIYVANRFTTCFYEQVAKGYPVDIAAQLGRLAIALEPPYYDSRDFATSVIFMRGHDGYLFERLEVEVEPVTPETIRALLAEADIEFEEAEDAEVYGNEFAQMPSGGEHRAKIKGRLVKRSKIVGNRYGKL